VPKAFAICANIFVVNSGILQALETTNGAEVPRHLTKSSGWVSAMAALMQGACGGKLYSGMIQSIGKLRYLE
jgi:hypothetical protein